PCLDVGDAGLIAVGAADPDRRAAADVVDEVVGARLDRIEAEEGHHPVVEGDALLDPVRPEDDVRDAVDLDHAPRTVGNGTGAPGWRARAPPGPGPSERRSARP